MDTGDMEFFHGREVYRLSSEGMEALVDPAHGMSVVSLQYQGREFLHYDHQRFLSHNTYGVSILFPTPNRVDNGVFLFDGLSYGPMSMHGFAKEVQFIVEGVNPGNPILHRLTGVYRLTAHEPEFPAYPFPLELSVSISVSEDGIRWEYAVLNQGTRRLGYGLGLHPFFVAPEKAILRLGADYIMENSSEKLPTGALISTADTPYDLRDGRCIDTLNLDTVYYHPVSPDCTVSYKDFNTELHFLTSSEFHHVVVYTPHDRPFFCIEPQTSSADCHNLYAKGLQSISGLTVVEPGQRSEGWVEIVFSPCR